MSPLAAKLDRFINASPEIVFEWRDPHTAAAGWLVINSLRGGAAGGGTRMRSGLDRAEVTTLAKTMEIKFTVSGPAIGGAKSGINFNPSDPKKGEVLDRWFRAITPLLKRYYGTGGDLNVDEIKEVIPCLERCGVEHPQEGVLMGHLRPNEGAKREKIARLKRGVSLPVESGELTPQSGRFRVADLITGFGVAEAARCYYSAFGGSIEGKTVAVQGWGNVGAAAGFYLAKMGARIVAISDKDGGVIRGAGYSLEEVRELFLTKEGNRLVSREKIGSKEMAARLFDVGAEIFIPGAASRVITQHDGTQLLRGGTELIVCGANAPFQEERMLFGSVTEMIDERIALIPDFVANAGMARAFGYLMSEAVDVGEKAIFDDVSRCIGDAVSAVRDRGERRTGITARAFEIALGKIAGV
ncbi:MAG: hypothetical protein RL417_259 [Pseudomonadota bacterium]|jgi:glutamate dehydrogenase (NAD(P)+)